MYLHDYSTHIELMSRDCYSLFLQICGNCKAYASEILIESYSSCFEELALITISGVHSRSAVSCSQFDLFASLQKLLVAKCDKVDKKIKFMMCGTCY